MALAIVYVYLDFYRGGEMDFKNYIREANTLVFRGGPNSSEYKNLTVACQDLREQELTLSEESELYGMMEPLLTVDSMIGFSYVKPNGYAGDYELIDRIYQKWTSPSHDEFHLWDDFYHNLDAAKAVRNRKKYLIKLLTQLQSKKESPLVLNLGSGPCSDLLEFFKQVPQSKIHFDCLDMDSKAIEYASAVCDNYIDSITFINKNAFRYKPDYKYEFIWSAGLFDYFSDKLFVRLLNRTYNLVADGGTLAIGNFSDNNPSRGVMEIFGQWYLHHRSKDTLVGLALKAGVPGNKIEVFSEETGVNLFLHLQK